MTEPQLIFLQEGAFRKGRLVGYDESRYIGLDIKGNCVLEGDTISPLALQLVYATALSPRLLKEMQPEIKEDVLLSKFLNNKIQTPDRSYRGHARHIEGVVNGIVDEALHLAKDSGVPYFSVAAVTAATEALDLNRLFSEEMQNLYSDIRNTLLSHPTREVQFTLHPTAQLYVPR